MKVICYIVIDLTEIFYIVYANVSGMYTRPIIELCAQKTIKLATSEHSSSLL